ncbi:hypothetical protein BU14_0308s0014 [Porphyra umbilicalis]|uniref:Uncharacterized protein n=1 Tax=Porphyra umbilicalis TaxID=2786 RepID=A0A1X6NZV5_PORUM|nr:hypothetical protein BU14_0308s0014 [Porphyra umbilicalis]|eukprot:OSX74097.1 hypothetical protein BU14_0308s0014 [Porphyra umbilicalis]
MVADRARARVLPAVDGVAFAPVFDVSLSLVVNATAASVGEVTARLAAGAVTQTGPAEGTVDVGGLALPAADAAGVEVEARLNNCGTNDMGGDAVALERTVGGRS